MGDIMGQAAEAGVPQNGPSPSVPAAADKAVNTVNATLQGIQNEFQRISTDFGTNGQGKTKEELEAILQNLSAMVAKVDAASQAYTVKFEELASRATSVGMNINTTNKVGAKNALTMKVDKLQRLEGKIKEAERTLDALRTQIASTIERLRKNIEGE